MTSIHRYLSDTNVKRLLTLLILIIILFWPVINEMYETWMRDSNNSHGILVPLIVVYLIRDRLIKDKDSFRQSTLEKRHINIGFIGIMGALLLYLFSSIVDIVAFKNISFVFSLQSIVLFVFGWGVFYKLLFPLFFLLFMIPVPVTVHGLVSLPMQLFSTRLTVFILKFTSLPVVADGNIIRIGNEMLTVAEACSGLRSLMSFIMLSLLFAYLAKISYWKKGLMVLSSVPIAISGNIVRLIFTSFIAYIYGSRVASGFIHDASGYVMFVLAFVVFFWLSRILERSS